MSLVLEVLRDKPTGFWLCDSTSPFTDYSSYGRSATATVNNSIGLVNGASKSLVLSSAHVATFASNIFKQGLEAQPFSLEVWTRPIVKDATDPAEQQILGTNGNMDGITINGTVVSFVTKYLTTGESRASYDVQELRSMHIVGIHAKDKSQLYIDGVLVDEQEISEEQKADSFKATNANLYSGATTSTRQLAINGVGIYSSALSETSVKRHFHAGRQPRQTVFDFYGEDRIEMADTMSNMLFETTFSSDDDWNSGLIVRMTVEDGTLVPQFVTGASVPGTWKNSIDLYNADVASPIQAVSINWDGSGATIKASIDGDTWETVERNKNLSSIPAGFDPTGTELLIEISYPGGIFDDESFLNSLTIKGFKSNVYAANDVVTVTYNGQPSIAAVHEPIELNDDWGIIFDGDYLQIGPDSTATLIPQTLEIWFKVTESTNMMLADTRAAGATANTYASLTYSSGTVTKQNCTIYANGVANPSSPPPIGEWVVWHIVSSTPIDKPIFINSNYLGTTHGVVQVGKVSMYEDQLSASQVSDLVSAASGGSAIRISDSSDVALTESASTPAIYAHDWSILSTG